MLIKVGALTIEYPPLGDSPEEREAKWCARKIAEHLTYLNRQAGGQNGPGRGDVPRTWRDLAEGPLQCRVYEVFDPLGDLGEYSRTPKGTGIIVINTYATEYMQARALAHELSHHLMWELSLLPLDCEDPRFFCERVARCVERMVVG